MNKSIVVYAGLAIAGTLAVAFLLRSSSKAAGAIAGAAGAAAQAINPLNPDNVFSQAATAATQSATGTPNSFGTWLAETFSPTTRAADAAMRGLNNGSTVARVTVGDRDDSELGAAMRSIFAPAIPSIDLGEYASTVARDDMDFARFARINEFQAPTGPAIWDTNATARLFTLSRRGLAAGATNSEFE